MLWKTEADKSLTLGLIQSCNGSQPHGFRIPSKVDKHTFHTTPGIEIQVPSSEERLNLTCRRPTVAAEH